jgi:hypothetical protein
MDKTECNEITQTVFDYSAIDTDITIYLKQCAQETRKLLKRTTEDIIKIGQNLLEAKKRLPHGQYVPWLKSEFGISQSTAWRFTQIAQGKDIKKKSFTVNDLVEQISAPGPDAETVVETVVQRSHEHEGIIYRPEKEIQPFEVELMNWDEGKLNPHSAEGLTEKRISRKVAKNRGGVRKCHKKWSIKRNDWIIWE